MTQRALQTINIFAILVCLGQHCSFGLNHISHLLTTYHRHVSVRNKNIHRLHMTTDDLKTAILQHMNDVSKGPFLIVASHNKIFDLHPNITYATDIIKGSGASSYTDMTREWLTKVMPELTEAVFSATDVTYIQKDKVSIRWNVTYLPESLVGLVRFARLNPLWRVRFFNLLDKEAVRSQFSWKVLVVFLERALFQGTVLLPHAVIVGSTELSFDPPIDQKSATQTGNYIIGTVEPTNIVVASQHTNSVASGGDNTTSIGNEFVRDFAPSAGSDAPTLQSVHKSVVPIPSQDVISESSKITIQDTGITTPDTSKSGTAESSSPPNKARKNTWILRSSKEQLRLVRSIDAGVLKNRKLALDLLEFLDARKPSTVGLSDWNDILTSRLPTGNIPGMRQLDIDGLESEQQTQALEGVSRVLGLFTGLVLASGVIFGTITINKVFSYRQAQELKVKIADELSSYYGKQ